MDIPSGDAGDAINDCDVEVDMPMSRSRKHGYDGGCATCMPSFVATFGRRLTGITRFAECGDHHSSSSALLTCQSAHADGKGWNGNLGR